MSPKPKLPPLTAPPADLEAVRWYDLDELIIWKDNYNEGDVGSIAGSIRRFGFANDPRVWQGAHVRGGNHTVMALRLIKGEGKRAGDLHYPPARVRVEGDKWLIACADISYLSEQDAIAFAISDNHQAQKASQDDKKLLDYLTAMDRSTLLAVGYDEDDINYLTLMVNAEPVIPLDKVSDGEGDNGLFPAHEHVIEINCSSGDLDVFGAILDQWAQRPGVVINIL